MFFWIPGFFSFWFETKRLLNTMFALIWRSKRDYGPGRHRTRRKLVQKGHCQAQMEQIQKQCEAKESAKPVEHPAKTRIERVQLGRERISHGFGRGPSRRERSIARHIQRGLLLGGQGLLQYVQGRFQRHRRLLKWSIRPSCDSANAVERRGLGGIRWECAGLGPAFYSTMEPVQSKHSIHSTHLALIGI